MVKRALTLLTSILFALPLLMPFNIYAQDNAVVVGTDVSLVSSNLLKTDEWSITSGTMTGYYNQFIYHVTVQLDNNYVGYINFSLNISYMNRPQSGLRQDTETITRKVFINGDKAEFNFDITSWYSDDPLLRNTTNGTPNAVIQEQGVTLLSELDSIQQIIDILNDLYNSQDQVEGLLNDQLAQLQLVVSNTSLANQYLDSINKIRQYNFTMESFPFIHYLLYYRQLDPIDIYKDYYYNYPIFDFANKSNQSLYQLYAGPLYYQDYLLIFNMYSARTMDTSSIFLEYFSFSDINIKKYEILSSPYGTLTCKITFNFLSRGNKELIYKGTLPYFQFTPIYIGLYDKNYSTDFALIYGLSNKLLDDLNLIANGTSESQSAADSSQSANEQLQTDSNTLFTQEDNFKSDMNNAMQNVNNTFRLSDMGTKFVSSAQWVRTQYENLTNNTPFASLITFSLITGLALILLGKVYK